MNSEALARRKSLLVAQSHLHRLQAGMAWYDVRQVVSPSPFAPERGDRVRSIAATLVGITVPVFGLSRLGRIMRVVSIGLMIMRVVRSLRSRS
jgi:MFS superfamily sulfate permease-like transporter